MTRRPSSSTAWEKTVRVGFVAIALFLGSSLGCDAAGIRITHLNKEVKLLPARAATLGQLLRPNDAIRTGPGARVELTLPDQSIARLGANSFVELREGGSVANLREGALLFQIPPNASGPKIKTAAITASSTGATGIVERHEKYYIKILLLEGEARIYMEGQVGESIVMHAGQLLITKPDATVLPEPAHFDIARAARTCRLLSDFRPLASRNLISLEIQKQADLTRKGTYIPSNLVIFGRGTLVSLVPPEPAARNERKIQHNAKPGS